MTREALPTFNRGLRGAAACIVLAALTTIPPALPQRVLPLMPMPREVVRLEGALPLTGPISPEVIGCGDGLVPAALERFRRHFAEIVGTNLSGAPTSIRIRCLANDPKLATLNVREGYRLSVTPAAVIIEADAQTGVLRALATLRQLITRSSAGPVVPALRIEDSPRFAWRGLMIDTARNFVSVPTLKRQIDAMEQAKLNVLHLHLSDNEGFRVQSRLYPKLTARGEFYTQLEIVDLVAYAESRGVRIVPEIDLPAHSQAILAAYPELGVAPIDPKDRFAKPKSALNPASKATYRFLERLLPELAGLFRDPIFHVGGDEVSSIAWDGSVEVAAFKKAKRLATKRDVEDFFHARVRAILASAGKSTSGWDEMADGALPKHVIVQVWRTSNPISTVTARGNRVVVSAGYYLNDLRPADWHYRIDPLDPMAYETMTAAALAAVRRHPVNAAMVSDGLVGRPTPPLTPEQEKLVIGGEAPLWAEAVNDELLDGRIWPRALALAERFWSSASLRDPESMYARMLPAMDRLRALGLLDEQRRARMIARLAPDEPEVVGRLVGLVAPTRVFTNHIEALLTGKPPELVELTDAASTDGAAARRFRVNVSDYLGGDRARAELLRAELQQWVANEAAFRRAAIGMPLLERAVPTAKDVADLGRLALQALGAIEAGRAMGGPALKAGHALLARLKAFEDASKDYGTASPKQPPAALIILPHADVARLVAAAELRR